MCNTREIYSILSILQFSFSILTVISSLFIAFIYFNLRESQDISYRILFYMAITDIARVIPFFLPESLNDNYYSCQVFAIVINGSLLVNAVWSCYIIFNLYRIFLKFPSKPKRYLKTWLIIGFIIAPITQLLPIITDSYGYNQGGCSYKNDFYGVLWRSIQEISIFLALLISIVLYLRVYVKMKKLYDVSLKEIVFEKGMIFSLIFFFIMIVVLLFRYAEILFEFCDIYYLSIAAYSLVILHGTLNFIALSANKNFRSYLRNVFCRGNRRSDTMEILEEMFNNDEIGK